MTPSPTKIELVGDTLAIAWPDGKENFLEASYLRKRSPSAEQSGEADIFGVVSGGNANDDFSGVGIRAFSYVGNYAIRIQFSDGHTTGIYSWGYLAEISSDSLG
jgi:DUF971 family protein